MAGDTSHRLIESFINKRGYMTTKIVSKGGFRYMQFTQGKRYAKVVLELLDNMTLETIQAKLLPQIIDNITD